MTRKRAASVALLVRTLGLERSIACLTIACSTVLAEVNVSPPPARVVLWDRFEVTSVNRRPYSTAIRATTWPWTSSTSGPAALRSDPGHSTIGGNVEDALHARAAWSLALSRALFRLHLGGHGNERPPRPHPRAAPGRSLPCHQLIGRQAARVFLIWRAVKATTGCRSRAIPRVAISTAAAKAGECRGSGPSMRASTVV